MYVCVYKYVWVYMLVCECVCVCVRACAGDHGGQKRALDPLQLELHVLVSSLTCMLGTELSSF